MVPVLSSAPQCPVHCGLASTSSILFNCQTVDGFPVARNKSCYFFSLLICHHWFSTPVELSSPLLSRAFLVSSFMFLLHRLPSLGHLCLFLNCPPNLGVRQSPLISHIHTVQDILFLNSFNQKLKFQVSPMFKWYSAWALSLVTDSNFWLLI